MAQNYITELFEALGYDVEIQEFSFQPWWSDESNIMNLTNIMTNLENIFKLTDLFRSSL